LAAATLEGPWLIHHQAAPAAISGKASSAARIDERMAGRFSLALVVARRGAQFIQ